MKKCALIFLISLVGACNQPQNHEEEIPSYPTGLVPFERIVNANNEPGSWLTYSGNLAAQRYSALDQINASNVSDLKVAWIYQMQRSGLVETTPIVVDGVVMTKTSNTLQMVNPKFLIKFVNLKI